MKLSVVLESMVSVITTEPCEISITNGYVDVRKEGVLKLQISQEKVRIFNLKDRPYNAGLNEEEMAELHSLWRLIKWEEVNEITNGLVDCMPPFFEVNTLILDNINMYKRVLLKTGVNEFKQFKKFFETEYRY